MTEIAAQLMAKELRFKPPRKLMGYLSLLARDTLLGDTENEVALALLTIEAERRMFEDYHAKVVPTAEPKEK